MSLVEVFAGVGQSRHLLKPHSGKELKECQLCDSRRLRKKAQDAQDDGSICLMPQFSPQTVTEGHPEKAGDEVTDYDS